MFTLKTIIIIIVAAVLAYIGYEKFIK